MKKLSIIILLFTVMLCSFSSCKKCYTCDFDKKGTQELCNKDFPDGYDGLQLSVKAFEEQGYKCTEK